MKSRKTFKLLNLIGLFSVVSVIVSSCNNLASKYYKQPIKPQTPKISNPITPISKKPIDPNEVLLNQADTVLKRIKPKDVIIQGGQRGVLASQLDPSKLSVALDNKFNNFKQKFVIEKADDKSGIVDVSLSLIDRANPELQTEPVDLKLQGFSNEVNDIAVQVFDNFYDRNIILGDVAWNSLEDLIKPDAFGEYSKNNHTKIHKNNSSLEDKADTLMNSLFQKRFLSADLTDFFIKGDFDVRDIPTNDAEGNVVVKLVAKNNSKIEVTNELYNKNKISFNVNSIIVTNLKPTQISIRAISGDKQSHNNFSAYKNETDPSSLVAKSSKDNNSKYLSTDTMTTTVTKKYNQVGEDYLGLEIKDKYWIIDPISIPYNANDLSGYKILVVVKFGIHGQFLVSNAYSYKVYAKSIITDDYYLNDNQKQFLNRNTVTPQVFSYIGYYRNNIDEFLAPSVDRNKLKAFITYNDQNVSGQFDDNKNVPGSDGNNIFVATDITNQWTTKFQQNASNNMLFIVGFKSKKPTSPMLFNPNLTILNIKYNNK
ncbi:hypothetical protein [Mycoplasma sp. E35C]|uniref:hypothetical protein n=1 Tax=Mycoplasma sp. E35C TaxID=2801918 RepID=UPI001CA3B0B0|nr:hypothetical protein [Mycoplasma sp. E35C]QZX48854.1 hypothetical protein JJE79_02215 [Mycoplasma sp. E35C]